MGPRVNERLRKFSIELPQPSTPGANYVPFVRTGDLVFVTGQLSQWNGERRFVGKVGREFSADEGRQAARLCALNVLAQLRVAVDGDLDRVVRCVRVAGYVNSVPEFVGQSQVMNGASDVFVEVLGEAGRHARMAVGVSALPYDVAVEVEACFESGRRAASRQAFVSTTLWTSRARARPAGPVSGDGSHPAPLSKE
jgi:enamine deaminase RidA (YjgF/YER057c/UK114 family)